MKHGKPTNMGQVGACQFGTFSCPSAPPFQLSCDTPAPGTPRVGSMRVRVHRKFQKTPTCSSYTVTATTPDRGAAPATTIA